LSCIGDTVVVTSPVALIGTWDLRRRLVDRVAGIAGSVSGTLTLREVGDGLEWFERGLFRWDRHEVPVTRRYLLRDTADGWWVQFDDGRPFHPWTPGVVVEHPCRADVYRGVVDVQGADRWRVLWDVTGPRKEQRIISRLRRVQGQVRRR
jgi:hypothetical protein